VGTSGVLGSWSSPRDRAVDVMPRILAEFYLTALIYATVGLDGWATAWMLNPGFLAEVALLYLCPQETVLPW